MSDESFLDEVEVVEQPELRPVQRIQDLLKIPTVMPPPEVLANMRKRDANDIAADFGKRFGPEVGFVQFRNGLKEAIENAPVVHRAHSRITKLTEIHKKYPELREPVIHGLLRQGEIMNIISATKVGKSFIANDLATTIAQGGEWFGKFKTKARRVLIVDNELHPETISFRTQLIARRRAKTEMGVQYLCSRIDIVSLRGELVDLKGLAKEFKYIARNEYGLIILDAFYRFMPPKTDENDNGQMAGLYNLLDKYAAKTNSAICVIHHMSKGNQSLKKVTDLGSGAGVQSRATDTHLVLRAHKTKGVVVLDAAVRSFKPLQPFCIKSDFPSWKLDPDSKPEDLDDGKPATPGSNTRDFKEREKQRLLAAITVDMTVDDLVYQATQLKLRSLEYSAVQAAIKRDWLLNRLVRVTGNKDGKTTYINSNITEVAGNRTTPHELLIPPADEHSSRAGSDATADDPRG